MLARQDGGKPSLSWERYKVRAACLAAEQRYGLRATAPADCTAARRPTRAENEKAARRGLDEAPRITLRRQVTTAAASAGSEQEFFARLDQAGVLVRKRFSTRNPGQVTGYSVALAGDTAKDAGPVWYGGGKLAPDLSWPKLRQRWTPYRVTPGAGRLTIEQRNAVWEHAARVAADAAAQIRNLAGTDPAAVTDAVLGHLRHPPRGCRRTRQPHPSPGRRRLRPRRPLTLWPHPAAHPGWEPTPPGGPAAVRVRLPDRRPLHGPDHAHHATGRAGRSRRRTPRRPAARRPGRRSPRRRRTTVRRRTPGTACTPAPGPARQHRRPARQAVFPPVTPACDTRTARSGSRRTATSATAAATAPSAAPGTARMTSNPDVRAGHGARAPPVPRAWPVAATSPGTPAGSACLPRCDPEEEPRTASTVSRWESAPAPATEAIARIALTCGRGLRAVGSGPDLGRWWCEGGLEHFDEEVRDHRCNDDQRRDRGSGARSQQQRDHHCR